MLSGVHNSRVEAEGTQETAHARHACGQSAPSAAPYERVSLPSVHSLVGLLAARLMSGRPLDVA